MQLVHHHLCRLREVRRLKQLSKQLCLLTHLFRDLLDHVVMQSLVAKGRILDLCLDRMEHQHHAPLPPQEVDPRGD